MNGASDDIVQRNEHSPYLHQLPYCVEKGTTSLTIQEKAAETHEDEVHLSQRPNIVT